MQTRERIHRLIDELPEGELPAVERFLAEHGVVADPFLGALAAAPDDEPLTPDEEAAIDEGLDAIERGQIVPQTELRRSLGL